MSDLRVTNLKGRTAGSVPTLPDGAVISGIATVTTLQATTINATTITATTYSGIPASFDWRDGSLF